MAVRKKMKLAVPGNPLDPIDTLCKILTCDSDYSMVKSVGCLDPRFQHRFALSKELMEQIHKFLRALKKRHVNATSFQRHTHGPSFPL